MFRRVDDADAVVVESVEVAAVSSLDALSQMTISACQRRSLEQDVLDALLEEVHAVVRQDDDRDRPCRGMATSAVDDPSGFAVTAHSQSSARS